jgi:gamma-glutamylcyclotransferase (GGCT)/AIG2-like uncharacterized protein YtfP
MADPAAGQSLFCYGTLGPAFPRGRGFRDWVADAVRGRLYDLGPHPALVDCDDPTAGWVEGHVRATDLTELTQVLDPYEGMAEGQFRRVLVRTRGGRSAWVYVFAGCLPQYARGPLERWPGDATLGAEDRRGGT